MRLIRIRLTKRWTLIVAAVAIVATLAAYCVWPHGFTVKIVNRTTGAMTQVRLFLRDGTQVELGSIPPGEETSAVIFLDQAADIRLVYIQPDGVTNDLIRVGFRPWSAPTREKKVVFGVMSHMTKSNPKSMRFYIKQRSIWDPAKYFPFAPGAGD